MILTVAMTMVSCNRKTVYDRYLPTSDDGWEKCDTLTFCIPAVKENGTYKEEIGLRITDSYPFTKLCLIVEQTVMPAEVTRCDTLYCRLIDDDGKVKGRGLSHYQYKFHLTSIALAQGDSLCVNIRHNMRREILPGISDVGMRLTNIQNGN